MVQEIIEDIIDLVFQAEDSASLDAQSDYIVNDQVIESNFA